VYVALVGLSAFALMFGLAGLDAGGLAREFRARTPVKGIAAFMAFVARWA
jgi:hypothetical protein